MFRARESRLCIFVLICIVHFTGAINVTIVDQLTTDYLKAEQELWKVVERREPDALDQIYNVHSQFLNRDFGETYVLLNKTYAKKLPDRVLDKIIEINRTSHDILDAISRHEITNEQALVGKKLYRKLDVILDATTGTNCGEFVNELLEVRAAVRLRR